MFRQVTYTALGMVCGIPIPFILMRMARNEGTSKTVRMNRVRIAFVAQTGLGLYFIYMSRQFRSYMGQVEEKYFKNVPLNDIMKVGSQQQML